MVNKDTAQNSADKDEKEKDLTQGKTNDSKSTFEFTTKNKIILGISLITVSLITLVAGFILHIPSCKSSGMQAKVKEYLTSNFSDMGDISFDKSTAHKLKRIEKGYSCSVNATIDDTPTKIEYSYKKVSLNEYDINAKFVLPNCFDSGVKKLLNDTIKDYDSYGIKNNTAEVYTSHEVQNNYDKDSVSYSCSSDATLSSKAGKAYVLNSWDYQDASRTINCRVDYRTFFCNNGYTTCVSVNDIYGCEYKDE